MSLEINNTALYNLKGIDTASVAKVSGEILGANANNAPQVKGIDYSKFNRATLGVDLYSSRTNADLQRQIALTQAGLYTKSVNVAQLNSSAAASLYSAATVAKNVGLTQSTTANEILAAPKQLENTDKNIRLFNIADKHAGASNGFNPFEEEDGDASREEAEA